MLQRVLSGVLALPLSHTMVAPSGGLSPCHPMQVLPEASVPREHLHQAVRESAMPPIHPLWQEWENGPGSSANSLGLRLFAMDGEMLPGMGSRYLCRTLRDLLS